LRRRPLFHSPERPFKHIDYLGLWLVLPAVKVAKKHLLVTVTPRRTLSSAKMRLAGQPHQLTVNRNSMSFDAWVVGFGFSNRGGLAPLCSVGRD
jgi:hypothetical protein